MKDFLVSIFNLIRFLNIEKEKKEFVFYSESKFYRDYFIDLVNSLKKKGIDNIILISSDKDDVKFFKENLTCLFIKNFFILSIFFKMLNCKFMIMTLTDLGYHFQKSKLCKYYVYYFHAIASTHQQYTKSAFENYDIIFSNGDYHTKELKVIEDQFNLKKKEIINTGYFFLDNLKKKANLDLKQKKQILFAPSWNYNKENLFDDYSIKIISMLLSEDFSVTLRPHPEHYNRSSESIDKIKDMFLSNKNFILDKNVSNLHSMEKAELLITDNSSIVFEFLFVFKRPIIYVDYTDKIHNVDRSKISIDTIEDHFKKEFGNIINVNDLKNLPFFCEKISVRNELNNSQIESFEKKYISNLETSASYAANYLVNKSKLI